MRKKKLRRNPFLDKLIREYTDSNNIYPKGMTDTEFVKFTIEYFFGEDYYIADPLSHNQINTALLKEIILNH